MTETDELFRRRLVVRLPGTSAEQRDGTTDRVVRGVARGTAGLLLAMMMILGVALAVTSAVLAELDDWQGVGAFGTELGAAMWFGAAIAWGGRREATVGRGVLLGLVFVAGAALVAAALVLGWSGVGLTLAMEFGVGMLAVPLIDVVLIGTVHRNLTMLGDESTVPAVELSIGNDGRLVHIERLDR